MSAVPALALPLVPPWKFDPTPRAPVGADAALLRSRRKRSGELLHLDTKRLGRIKGIGHRITGNHALAWFRDRDVLVERVMTDNGGCHRSHRFRRAVQAWGARQIYTRPYWPQTNGKAERFIQTAKREWAYRRVSPTT